MRRVVTSVLLAGAMALAIPQVMHAQRGGHVGGGGHAGGFSGGGGARGFGGGGTGSFSGSRGGFTSPTFQAPRMNFMPGPVGPGSTARPYAGFPASRPSFGQMGSPAVRRVPYPLPGVSRGPYPVSGTSGGKTWNGQGWNGQGWHGGYPDGHHRPYYDHGHLIYTYPFYTAGLTNWWLWPWPYFGWDSPSYDDPEPQATAQPDQYYAPAQEPEAEPEARPAYQPYQPDSPTASPDPEPALTVIYKDGHSQEIHNYAVTRTSLLVLDEASTGRTPEISLDEINLAATEQVNRAAGVNFKVPVRN